MDNLSTCFKIEKENTEILSPDKSLDFICKFYSPPKTTLSIEITKACNLRCSGCWTKFTRDNLWNHNDLTIDDILLERTLRFGRYAGINKVQLIGGEPTLHPNLSHIIKKAISFGYKGVSVTTNGVFKTSQLEALVTSGLHSISFSIDGSSTVIHESIRPSLSGNSTFATTINNLRKAIFYGKEYGFDVIVNHTLFPKNISDTEAMIRLVANLGVKKIRIHFAFFEDDALCNYGKGSNPSVKVGSYIAPEAWLKACRQCEILSNQLNTEIAIAPCYGKKEALKAKTMQPSYLQVQSNGNLLMCLTHARLGDRRKRYFGRIINETQIELNKESILFDHVIVGTCCKAIPMLIAGLPEELQTKISEAGGLGCIYLPGPLVS